MSSTMYARSVKIAAQSHIKVSHISSRIQYCIPSRLISGRSNRLSLQCRAGDSKEPDTAEETKVQVPDVPPAKGNTAESSVVTSSSDDDQKLSPEEIGAQLGQLRAAAKEQSQKEGLLEGVLEEVSLISWPAPQAALLNTLLVIVIVGGTSAVLFGVNTLLTELSRAVYSANLG